MVRNCIFWNNGSIPLYMINGTLNNITYCNIEGGYLGEGNIDVDPCFSGDANHSYSPDAWSYCLNAGTPDPSG